MVTFHVLKKGYTRDAWGNDDVVWTYDCAVEADTKLGAKRKYTARTGQRFTGVNACMLLTEEEWAADTANPNRVADAKPVGREPEGVEGLRKRFDAAVAAVPRSTVPPTEIERVLRDRLKRGDLSTDSGANGRTPERWAARGPRGGWYKSVRVSFGDEFAVGGEAWLAFSWRDGKTPCVGVMRVAEYDAAVCAGVFKGGGGR